MMSYEKLMTFGHTKMEGYLSPIIHLHQHDKIYTMDQSYRN